MLCLKTSEIFPIQSYLALSPFSISHPSPTKSRNERGREFFLLLLKFLYKCLLIPFVTRNYVQYLHFKLACGVCTRKSVFQNVGGKALDFESILWNNYFEHEVCNDKNQCKFGVIMSRAMTRVARSE